MSELIRQKQFLDRAAAIIPHLYCKRFNVEFNDDGDIIEYRDGYQPETLEQFDNVPRDIDRIDVDLYLCQDDTRPHETITIHRTERGSWVLVSWDSRNNQYTSGDATASVRRYHPNLAYVFARRFEGILPEINHYKSPGQALKAAITIQ